jgi:hypothetical protein
MTHHVRSTAPSSITQVGNILKRHSFEDFQVHYFALLRRQITKRALDRQPFIDAVVGGVHAVQEPLMIDRRTLASPAPQHAETFVADRSLQVVLLSLEPIALPVDEAREYLVHRIRRLLRVRAIQSLVASSRRVMRSEL